MNQPVATNQPANERELMKLFAVATVAYAVYAFILIAVLDFKIIQSDVKVYWRDSQNLSIPYSTWFVPGYPFVIAAARLITFNQLPPEAVLILISFISYIAAIYAFFKYALSYGVGAEVSVKLSLLFAFYPLVGLAYTVYPLADGLTFALLMFVFLFWRREQWWLFAAACSAAMIVHKVTWFFIFPILLAVFLMQPRARFPIVLAFVPLIVLEIAGAIYHNDLLWMVRWSKSKLMSSRSSLPVFDSIGGSFLSGDPAKVIKGVILCGIFFWAMVLLVQSGRRRFVPGVLVSFGMLAMFAMVNHYEAWVIVRFSKFLCAPTVALLAVNNPDRFKLLERSGWMYAVLILSFASNLAYGFYMNRYFAE